MPGVLVVRDFAYESTPNAAIAAGDTGQQACDIELLDADLVYDGSTRTLIIDVTVRNNGGTAEAASLSLDYDRNGGPPQGTRNLGSGTLPAGATVSRTITLRVPNNAPAGTYNLTLNLSDGAGGDCGSYAESILITAPRVADGAADATGAGPLFAEAAPVDLSAGAVRRDSGVQHRNVDHAALRGQAVRGQAPAAASQALSAPANPFRGATTLQLQVPATQRVRVAVFDALGRQVAVLHEGTLAAGEAHRLAFDGSALPSGVYVVRAVGETFADVQVLTLTR
jgi:hypothetical protein